MAISKQQSMRPAEIELIDASNQHESTLQAHAQSLETLGKSLTTETTERKSADTELGTRIANEVQARTDADTALGTRIDNETQARTSSDANLQGQLQAHAQSLETLGKSLTTETTERKSADTELGTRIANEVQARTDADTALGTRIDNETQARTSSDANLQGQLSDIRDSVRLVPPLSKVEFDQIRGSEDERYGAITFFGSYGTFMVIFDKFGITIWDIAQSSAIKHVNWS